MKGKGDGGCFWAVIWGVILGLEVFGSGLFLLFFVYIGSWVGPPLFLDQG